MKTTLPEWLTQSFFYGEDPDFEESEDAPDEEDDEGSDEEADEDEEEGDDEDDENEAEDDEEDSEDDEEDAYEGLRLALNKERKLHRQERRARVKAERERDAAQARLSAGTKKESEAINQLQDQLDSERKKNTSLAKNLATQTIHTAIKNAADKLGFIDSEDALSVAKNIEVDQDDEDPTQVEVDEAEVLAEVKALAKKKPHLLGKKSTKKRVVSGSTAKSTNRTRQKRSTKSTRESELRSRYPSLQ